MSEARTRQRTVNADAGGGPPPPFDPVTSIAWAHLFYAAGPQFVALGLLDGASMAAVNWPDEIAANAVPLTGGSGTYRAADAVINSQPSVEMPVAGNGKMHASSVAVGAQVAQPFSIVAVFQLDSITPSDYFFDGANAGSSGNRVLVRATAGPVWSLFMGSDRTGGTPATGIQAVRVHAVSGNDLLTANGSTVISGVNAGDVTWQGVTLSESGVVMDGRFAFWGIYAGDITADGAWSDLQAWVLTTYGVSLS